MRIDQPLAVVAAKHAAAVLGASVGVLGLIIGIAVAATDIALGLTEILRLAVFITGAGFGSALVVRGDLDFIVSANGDIKLWLIPTLITLLAGGALAVLSARHEKTRRSTTGYELLGGALATGVVTAAVLFILGLISRGSFRVAEVGGSAVSFGVHLSLLSLLVGGLLVATTASLLGRAYTLRRSDLVTSARTRFKERIPMATGDLQTPVLFFGALVALGVPVFLIVIAFDNDDYFDSVLVVLAFLPTAALAAGALGMGATGIASMSASGEFVGYGESSSERFTIGMFGADDHMTYFLLLLPLAAALVAGIAAGARRPVMGGKLTSVWKSGAVTAGLFLLLGIVLRFTGSAHAAASYGDEFAGGGGRISAHVGLVSLVLVAFLWGCLARAAGVWLTIPLARRLPRTVEFLGRRAARAAGERSLAPGWAEELGSLARQLGRTPRLEGTAVTVGDQAVADGSHPQGLTAKPGTGKIAALAVAALVVLGSAWLTLDKVVAPLAYGPKAVAGTYFEKLQSGDAAGVLAMQSGKPSKGPLLTQAALEQQLEGAPISNVEIVAVKQAADVATVKATYKVGDELYKGSFELVPNEDRKHFGISPSWELATSTAVIEVFAGENASGATVDGIEVGKGTFEVFPGAHLVQATADESLFDTESNVTRVGFPGRYGSTTVDASLNAATTGAIEKAAIDQVNACADEGVIAPTGCSDDWPYMWADDDTEATYTWTVSPTATVYTDEYDGSLAVEVTGSFTVVYDYYGPETEEHDLEMTGTVDLTSGTPTVDFANNAWDW
jgi:hypothetical protein